MNNRSKLILANEIDKRRLFRDSRFAMHPSDEGMIGYYSIPIDDDSIKVKVYYKPVEIEPITEYISSAEWKDDVNSSAIKQCVCKINEIIDVVNKLVVGK